jgi:hypothetical protein
VLYFVGSLVGMSVVVIALVHVGRWIDRRGRSRCMHDADGHRYALESIERRGGVPFTSLDRELNEQIDKWDT